VSWIPLAGLLIIAALVSAGVALVGYLDKKALMMAVGLAVLIPILGLFALDAYLIFGCRLPDCHAP
jgi:hypothetical protein